MEYVRLGDLYSISKGKKVEELEIKHDAAIRYIQIEDLRNNNNLKYCLDTDKYVKVTENDIIIAWDGANAGTIGYGLKGAIGSTLAALKTDSQDIYPKYIGYYLSSKSQYLRDTCTGATIPHIQRSILESIKIPLLSLEEQIKVSNILDQAQELIDKRKAQIEALDELIQSMFYEIFGDPVLNKKGWSTDLLGNKCDIFRGGSPRPIKDYLGGNIPWIKIGDATNGENIYLYDTKEKIIEAGIKKSRLVPKGSLIFANCGVSLGFARIIKFDGCIHDGWLSFENIANDLNKIYLLKLMYLYTDYFRKTAPDGTQPNLNTKIMKEFEIIIPPIDLQERYVTIILNMEKQKELLNESLVELENNFNSLMKRVFNGEPLC